MKLALTLAAFSVWLSACSNEEPAAKLKAEAALCQSGLDAFTKTVYPLVRNNCAFCHDPGANSPVHGPPFAGTDTAAAYTLISKYQNFNNIAQSWFVVKGGSMTSQTSPQMIQTAVQAWWDQGEKTCPHGLNLKTASLAIPNPLPDKTQPPAHMRFDMTQVDPKYAGLYFELEIQRGANAESGHTGSYIVGRPRFLSSKENWHVSQMQIALNDAIQVGADVFTGVDAFIPAQPQVDPAQKIWPSAVASTATGVLIEGAAATDKIRVTFGEIATTSQTIDCHDKDDFLKFVKPEMELRGCQFCHGGDATNPTGDANAKARFDLSGDDTSICRNAARQGFWNDPINSPLIWYPVHGRPVHPWVISDPNELIPGWSDWLAKY